MEGCLQQAGQGPCCSSEATHELDLQLICRCDYDFRDSDAPFAQAEPLGPAFGTVVHPVCVAESLAEIFKQGICEHVAQAGRILLRLVASRPWTLWDLQLYLNSKWSHIAKSQRDTTSDDLVSYNSKKGFPLSELRESTTTKIPQ